MRYMPRAMAPLVTMTISSPAARRRATSSHTRPTTSTRSAPSSWATIDEPSLTTRRAIQRTTPSATDLRAAHDRVLAVREADPGLVRAVVVGRPEDERRGLAADGALLVALGVATGPDAEERVVLALLRHGRGQ